MEGRESDTDSVDETDPPLEIAPFELNLDEDDSDLGNTNCSRDGGDRLRSAVDDGQTRGVGFFVTSVAEDGGDIEAAQVDDQGKEQEGDDTQEDDRRSSVPGGSDGLTVKDYLIKDAADKDGSDGDAQAPGPYDKSKMDHQRDRDSGRRTSASGEDELVVKDFFSDNAAQEKRSSCGDVEAPEPHADSKDDDDNSAKITRDDSRRSSSGSQRGGRGQWLNPTASSKGVSTIAKSMQEKARRRASIAMRAYAGVLGEIRDSQRPLFISWTVEQIQEFLVLNGVEVRGAALISHAQYVAILEGMYKDCTEPPTPPDPLSYEAKERREKAARMLQEAWFHKKRAQFAMNQLLQQQKRDAHLRDNPLVSPRGVLAAAKRGRISEDTPWQKPSLQEAKKFEDDMHPRHPNGGKYDWIKTTTGRYSFIGHCGKHLDQWDERQISEFAPYGVGVTSYFKFLKFCSWSFVFATVLVLPHLLVNAAGTYIKATTNTDKLSWSTIGNLGTSTNVTEVTIPFCDDAQYDTCVVSKSQLGEYYAIIDSILVVLLLAAYYRFSSFIVDEFEVIKRNTVTAGDFTVLVENLPANVTEEELSTHFNTALKRTVAEVAVARDNRKCIHLYAQSGELYHQRAKTRDLIRYIKTKAIKQADWLERQNDDGGWWAEVKRSISDWKRNRKVRTLQRKREKACRQILNFAAEAKLEAKVPRERAAAAYVTFEREMGAVDARVKYSDSWLGWLFMSKKLKLRGRRLAVKEAPEPSTILWENYGFGKCELATRRSMTFLAAASFIGLSITTSILALYQNQQAEEAGGTGDCPDDWDSLTDAQQVDAVEKDEDILHCLCADTGFLSLNPDDVCFEFAKARMEAMWLMLTTSFVVAFTNAGINKIVKMMGAFEKHKCMDDQEVSIFRRLIILKFVNVGLTILITNNRAIIGTIGVTIDYEEDFTPEWYRTLGSSLVLTVAMNAITPHLYWCFLWARKEWRWKNTNGEAISQEALNDLTKGSRWEVSVRYAEIAVIFAVCVAYSSGIPILLPVGAVSFLIFYWIEKALFVNFYLTPPTYSVRLTNEVISLIPYCLWIHVVVAIYMYGNGSIFPAIPSSEDEMAEEAAENAADTFNFEAKIQVKAVMPLLVPFFGLTALILNHWLGQTVISAVAWVLAAITCKRKLKWNKLKRTCNVVPVDYSRACVRGILRGLPSYNILLNPKYKESFGLSDSFACQHNRVASIFMLLEEHPSIVDVRDTLRSAREAKRSPKRKKKAEERMKQFRQKDAARSPENSASDLTQNSPSGGTMARQNGGSDLSYATLLGERMTETPPETPPVGRVAQLLKGYKSGTNSRGQSGFGNKLRSSCSQPPETL